MMMMIMMMIISSFLHIYNNENIRTEKMYFLNVNILWIININIKLLIEGDNDILLFCFQKYDIWLLVLHMHLFLKFSNIFANKP